MDIGSHSGHRSRIAAAPPRLRERLARRVFRGQRAFRRGDGDREAFDGQIPDARGALPLDRERRRRLARWLIRELIDFSESSCGNVEVHERKERQSWKMTQ